jgi:hypothetical protein
MIKHMQAGLTIAAMLAGAATGALADDTAEETRDVSSFNEVFVKGSMDVEIKVGGERSVRVVADSDIIDNVETEVRGDELHIGLERGHYGNINKMIVYITVPSLEGAGVHGSGDLYVENAKADEFELELHGSGDAVFKDAVIGEMDIQLQGSGDIEMDGSCDTIEVELQGSGDVDAGDFVCKAADVLLQGSGDVHVHATEEAEIKVHGSGDVVVSGEPGKVRSKVRGSGDIEIRD